ncbi:Pyridoxamine 5'-phosphate oxidase [Anaerohalosphaera lusitana]|uniref:Pyridoxamine 5'-phosphate oxidase n=1 Tax=Anaerohalosphaera lusitana TaxID=1936003 RepID=A0A1U9NQ17_9BACT|nr:pyridoxamine 5'-phosphate oxidase family protein [Anaerohalosphaera lusitana]AQT69999.1 Pyridoxamine 5'-phosphate oxidase [Anaerohalosphaera lusitana]
MSLADYFENAQGTGILATTDADGNVDLAVYARPHVENEGTIAFVMADKLSHANLQSNPKAAYMFIEKTDGYQGKRLHLQKIREESDPELVESIRRRKRPDSPDASKSTAVYFKVTKIRPLVGG